MNDPHSPEDTDLKFLPKGPASDVAIGGVRAPAHVESAPSERHAIFMMGGGGSGKGEFVRGYVGDAERGVDPLPGFDAQRVIDCDAIKRTIPGYSDSDPSGPLRASDLRQELRTELDAWIRRKTPFGSVDNFAEAVFGTTETFGGGLIHEISSWLAKRRAAEAVADPRGGSFVYDGTGSEAYFAWATAALEAGYVVTFHDVVVPLEVAAKRNARRSRRVSDEALKNSHRKVEALRPQVLRFTQLMRAAGKPVFYVQSPNYREDEV